MSLLEFSKKIVQLVRNELVFGSGNSSADYERTDGWSDITTAISERPWEHSYERTEDRFFLKFTEDFARFKPSLQIMPEYLFELLKKHKVDHYVTEVPLIIEAAEDEPVEINRVQLVDWRFFRNTAQKIAESIQNRVGKCDDMANLFLHYFWERFQGNEEIKLYHFSCAFLDHAIVKITEGENTFYVDPWSQMVFSENDFDHHMRIILNTLKTEYEVEVKKDFSEIPNQNQGYKERVTQCLKNISEYLSKQEANPSEILPTDPALGFKMSFCVQKESEVIEGVPCIRAEDYLNLVNFYREVQLLTNRVMPIVAPKQQPQTFLTCFPRLGRSDKWPAPLSPALKEDIQKRRIN